MYYLTETYFYRGNDMAWESTLVNLLRNYIGDLDCDNQSFTDNQLKEYLVFAAELVTAENGNITTSFVFDRDTPDITPDPTSTTVQNGVAYLFVLRAGAIIALSEIRANVSKFGIRVKDDMTEFDGKAGMAGTMATLQAFVDNYESARKEWNWTNKATGRAIMGSYASADSPLNRS